MNEIGFFIIAIFAFLPIIALVSVLAYDIVVERSGGLFADPADFKDDADYHL